MSNVAQRSFAAGELAPVMYARTDQQKYATALRICRNALVLRQGGVTARPGTLFVADSKLGTDPVALLRFIFNDQQAYALEFGEQYVRFFQQGAPVTVGTPLAWDAATAYAVGDLIVSVGINYYCIAANTNQAPPNATYWYALSGNILEVPTPYAVADVRAIKYAQSGDVVTLVHPSYPPQNLSRLSATNWTVTPVIFNPVIQPPNTLAMAGEISGTINLRYAVTSVDPDGNESQPVYTTINTVLKLPTATAPISLTWLAPATGTVDHNNVYQAINGVWGLLGVVLNPAFLAFQDSGLVADYTVSIPKAFTDLQSADNYPSTVGYYQQRRLFGASNNEPQTLWASRTGKYDNFTSTIQQLDDESIKFTLSGEQANLLQWPVDLGRLVLFTQVGEWSIDGDANGVLTPTNVNAREFSVNGANALKPIVVDRALLFVQSLSFGVRELQNNLLYGYLGQDLSIMSAHLIENHTLTAWDFQKLPQAVAWMVRDDGILVGLTYVLEQQLAGWHHHDTLGTIEQVIVIPENGQYRTYLLVKRIIGGATYRYIEEFGLPFYENSDVVDYIGMDCASTFDGRNTNPTLTMTLSLIVDTSPWTVDDTLELTASAAAFGSMLVGDQIQLTGADGTVLRVTLTSIIDTTHALCQSLETVPTEFENVALAVWARAVVSLSGLHYLEGQAVSILGDGFVVASPNNSNYTPIIVTGGIVTLDAPYAVVHVGLPFITDLETLDIDTPQGPSLKEHNLNVTNVGVYVNRSRDLWAGRAAPTGSDPLAELMAYVARDTDDNVWAPPELLTRYFEIPIASTWNSTGRVLIRHVDPVPCTILAMMPYGYLGD